MFRGVSTETGTPRAARLEEHRAHLPEDRHHEGRDGRSHTYHGRIQRAPNGVGALRDERHLLVIRRIEFGDDIADVGFRVPAPRFGDIRVFRRYGKLCKVVDPSGEGREPRIMFAKPLVRRSEALRISAEDVRHAFRIRRTRFPDGVRTGSVSIATVSGNNIPRPTAS